MGFWYNTGQSKYYRTDQGVQRNLKSKLLHCLKCSSFVFHHKKELSPNTNMKKKNQITLVQKLSMTWWLFYYLPGLLAFLIGTFPAVQTTVLVPIFPAFLLLHLIKIRDTSRRQIMGSQWAWEFKRMLLHLLRTDLSQDFFFPII